MKTLTYLCSCLLLCLLPLTAPAKLLVAASVTDLASIAAAIGGTRVETFAIAKSYADPHAVEVLPTYMVKVSRADVYLKVGLGLDQWADQIIDGSRNSKLLVTDCSQNIPVLEKPAGKVDASMGDVHPEGNPHYWLSPQNGSLIAQTIADALTRADPAGGAEFQANLETFRAKLSSQYESWKLQLAALPSRDIVTYHSSWSYFAQAFDLRVLDKIEPVPGIPPSGAHLAMLVDEMKTDHVDLVLQEPYFAAEAAQFLKRETGARVVTISPSAADAAADAYEQHFTAVIQAILEAR